MTDLSDAAAAALFAQDVALNHEWFHGPAAGDGSTVPTESGPLPTPAKVLADLTAAVAGGLDLIAVDLTGSENDQAKAATNRTLLQAALDLGGIIRVKGSGYAYIDAPLVIGKNTILAPSPSLVIKRCDGAAFNILQSAAFNRAWTTVTLSWTEGPVCDVDWPNHGRSEGEYVWVRGEAGTTDRAYFGTLQVIDVPDTDTITVRLLQVPENAPAGDIEAKLCDTNIAFSGRYDWNATGMTGGAGTDFHAFMMDGVVGLTFGISDCVDVSKYVVCMEGCRDVRDFRVHSSGTNSDGVKIYGPAFNINGKITGRFGDDILSIQPREAAAFVVYDKAKGGNCRNIKVDQSEALANTINPGGTLHTYAHPDFDLDQIEIEMCGSPAIMASAPILIDCTEASGSTGRITVRGITSDDLTNYATGLVHVLGPQVVNHVVLENLAFPPNVTATAAQAGVHINPEARLKMLTIDGMSGVVNNNAIRIAGTCDHLDVAHATCVPAGAGANFINAVDHAGIGMISVRQSNLGAFDNIVLIQNVDSTLLKVLLDSVEGDALCGVNTAKAGVVTARNCYLPSATNGVVAASGSITIQVKDEGNNSYPAGKLTVGTATFKATTFAGESGTTFKDFLLPSSGALKADGSLGLGVDPSTLTGAPIFAGLKSQNAATRMIVRNNDSGSGATAEIAFNSFGNSWYMGTGSTAKNSNGFFIGLDITSPSNLLTIDTSGNHKFKGNLLPMTDNFSAIGSASFRAKDIFTVNAVTVGSDEALKTPLEAPPAALLAVGRDLLGKISVYQLLAAVAEKGADKARLHLGLSAQVVEATFANHGLDARRYGMFCEDNLFKVEQKTRKAQRQVTQKVTRQEPMWETVDGKARLSYVAVEAEEPVYEELPAVDADGNPLMIDQVPETVTVRMVVLDAENRPVLQAGEAVLIERETVVLDADQNPVMTGGRQFIVRHPKIEEWDEHYEEAVPDLDENGVQKIRRALRYEQALLLMMAAAFQSLPPH